MIDWDRVEELRDEIGDDDFVEVGRLFLSEIESKLAEMGTASAFSSADFHYLRGSAANLGFIEFAQCCAAAESEAKSNGPVNFAEVKQSFARARAEIGALFSD
ncbi:MAG: Hpt domain-containing protein [Pseudomonadota bacterium]